MATLERRLDRVLAVRVGGRRRWLHVEWQWEWEKAIAYRVYEYQALLAMAQRDPRNGLRRAPIESTVVLLSGRDAPWPARGRYRVSPRGEARGIAPVVHLFERKLGRALGDAEKELLRGRLHAVGPERLGDAVMDLDATALGAWLADASAT